jgi:hypothetical protein
MRKTLLLPTLGMAVFACSLLVSCEKEANEEHCMVDFENVVLDSTGVWNGSDLSGTPHTYASGYGYDITGYQGGFVSGSVTFANTFISPWSSWSGFACSNNTDTLTCSYFNQYSVHALSGADQSAKFGLIYEDGAVCSFPKAVNVQQMRINNSTWTYQSIKGHDSYAHALNASNSGYFLVRVKGYDTNNVLTDSLDIPLADFRDGKSYVCEQWTNVSLTKLGKVKKMVFAFEGSDNDSNGLRTPKYLCIDNLEYTFSE